MEQLQWNWNGKLMNLRDMDQRQLCSIKETLSKSNNNWFGKKKSEWVNAINPLLKQCENMNIKHIVYQKNTKRLVDANLMADQIIKCFTKNDIK